MIKMDIKTTICNKKILLWLIISLGLLLRIFYHVVTHYVSDDAFITYRYITNILAGNGYVYNYGEKVLGTTSPLYTLILACLCWLFSTENIPIISLGVSIVSAIASMFVLLNLIPGKYYLARVITILLVALYPKVVLIDISGMESTTAVFFMLFTLLSWEKRWFFFTTLSISFHLLTRPDSVIWNIILLCYFYFRERKINFNYVLLALITIGCWVIFSISYFDSLIPNSIIAKSVSWSHLFPAFDPMRIFIGYFPSYFAKESSYTTVIALFILSVIPFAIGFWKLWIDKSYLLLFPIFFILYNLIFSFGKVLMTDWYYLPGYVSYFVTISFFFEVLLEHSHSIIGIDKIKNFSIAFIIVVLLLLNFIGVNRWNQNLAGLFHRQNEALGKWLGKYSEPHKRVLVEPIGYIGYYSKLYIYDYIGLVSPEVIEYRRRYKSDKWYINFLKNKKPDYIVMRNWEIPTNSLFHGYGDGLFHSVEEKQWFENNYELVKWNSDTLNDSIFLVLYCLSPFHLTSVE